MPFYLSLKWKIIWRFCLLYDPSMINVEVYWEKFRSRIQLNKGKIKRSTQNARARARAHTHTHTHTHKHTQTHTHKHTHTHKQTNTHTNTHTHIYCRLTVIYVLAKMYMFRYTTYCCVLHNVSNKGRFSPNAIQSLTTITDAECFLGGRKWIFIYI